MICLILEGGPPLRVSPGRQVNNGTATVAAPFQQPGLAAIPPHLNPTKISFEACSKGEFSF